MDIRRPFGRFLHILEQIGLVIITLATLSAAGYDILHIIESGRATLADLLLLFLYLEVLAMVALYMREGQLPVRLPLYIAIVALARYLILDIKELDSWRLLIVTAAILILTLAILILRFGQTRYPYPGPRDRFAPLWKGPERRRGERRQADTP